MASRKQHIVERALGWMFVIVVIAAVAGVLAVATRPVEVTSRTQLQRAH